MTARIICGDCLDVMREMEPASIDAVVTDPPYGLGFMGKKWDTPGAFVERKPVRENTWDKVGGNHNPCNSRDQVRTRLTEGLRYQDAMEEVFAGALRVAKPGAHLLAFGGTRTFHRLTCAIEDAGWEIRDCLGWIYGSGFPKSKNLDGGLGTALKPAWEPIVLARAPLAGTVAATVCEHGTGALNIGACRIGTDVIKTCAKDHAASPQSGIGKTGFSGCPASDHIGRWPANIIHDGSDEVLEIFPKTSGGDKRGVCTGTRPGGFANTGADRGDGAPNARVYADTGSAARFFYCAKASRAERGEGNVHPTVKPLALMRYLCRLITPPGGLVLDPFAGSGTTGVAALLEGMDFVGIERDPQYAAVAERRLAEQRGAATLDQFAEVPA